MTEYFSDSRKKPKREKERHGKKSWSSTVDSSSIFSLKKKGDGGSLLKILLHGGGGKRVTGSKEPVLWEGPLSAGFHTKVEREGRREWEASRGAVHANADVVDQGGLEEGVRRSHHR